GKWEQKHVGASYPKTIIFEFGGPGYRSVQIQEYKEADDSLLYDYPSAKYEVVDDEKVNIVFDSDDPKSLPWVGREVLFSYSMDHGLLRLRGPGLAYDLTRVRQ